MSQIQTTTKAIDFEPRVGRSLWADACRRIRHDIPAMICLGIIVVYVLTAFSVGFFVTDWDKEHDYDNINQAPSWNNLLGTDAFGRSVLKKTLLGARVSLTVGFMANILAIPFGMLLGAIAGYYGGFLDDFVIWLFTTLSAVPGLIRVIAIKFAFQNVVLFKDTFFEADLGGLAGICFALAISRWIGTCRYVRAETMKIRELDYCLAARASGRSGFAILLNHVIPNVMHIGIINFSLGFVTAIAAEVSLSYLGLGLKDVPSWGTMINAARMDLVVGRWWELASAGVAMFILVLALNIFGDRLRDALDPKLRKA